MDSSIRLRFEYSEGKITLKDTSYVAKRAPASDLTPPGLHSKSPQNGIMLELRSGKEILYHRQVAAMFPDSYEVHTGDPARPFARSTRTQPYQVELLVPLPSRDVRLVLIEHRHDPAKRKGRAGPDIVHIDERLKLLSAPSPPSEP